MALTKIRTKKIRVLPGFKLTLGFTLFYLGLIVLIPLGAVFWMFAGHLRGRRNVRDMRTTLERIKKVVEEES